MNPVEKTREPSAVDTLARAVDQLGESVGRSLEIAHQLTGGWASPDEVGSGATKSSCGVFDTVEELAQAINGIRYRLDEANAAVQRRL